MLVQKEIARDRVTLNESDDSWVDVSVPIRSGMVHWPGNPAIVITHTEHLRRGDVATVSSLALGVHTGTHIDAPNHFILESGGVDTFRLDRLIGPARVIDMGDIVRIRQRDIEGLGIRAGDRILFKTRNSGFWKEKEFRSDYTCLVPEAARWLAERGVRTIGIDYLSIGPMDIPVETHVPLLAAGICVIEGLDLSGVGPGLYDLICLPLRLDGLDGAPARVVLRKVQRVQAPRAEELTS
ncbi:MAG TPA: cyclase family protein [Polyangia bacterium]|nr:cyclase family protein [Polyangia bacterium]